MPMPTADMYLPPPPPASAFDWQVAPGRIALLIQDMQYHVLRPYTPTAPPATDLLANAAALRETCHEAGIPVLYSVEPGGQHPDERGLLTDRWGPGPSTDHADIDLPPVLVPGLSDRVIVKRRYSAFVGTLLDEVLDELGRDQLLICGLHAHIGVLATALDAFMRDIQPFVVSDAVAAFTPEQHVMALRHVADCCGRALSTEQARTELRTPQPALAR
ncbi:isochorismatase family protein [Nonomuraea turcica]|uniref:isochorismatase family protein n=1 Tax=Nonomuraea sp. G32 TaxID=3067274 RepID=UPI00273ADE25|nr:isochorismatase family protein [Nonomuraea sp. G32]MDP4511833.1 isochorismatase family protein [Nonomuraea sp. G32]